MVRPCRPAAVAASAQTTQVNQTALQPRIVSRRRDESASNLGNQVNSCVCTCCCCLLRRRRSGLVHCVSSIARARAQLSTTANTAVAGTRAVCSTAWPVGAAVAGSTRRRRHGSTAAAAPAAGGSLTLTLRSVRALYSRIHTRRERLAPLAALLGGLLGKRPCKARSAV